MWLDSRNIKTTHPSKNLDHRFLGPFPIIERVSSHAFRLSLSLALSRIHPIVFYHSSSGRIFLVFGQDPSHSDEGLVPYMQYNPPCMATRPISFASDHLICLCLNQAE